MTHSLRSTFAALLAALALACAGLGVRAADADAGAGRHAPALRQNHGESLLSLAEQAPAPPFLRGGALVMEGLARRPGALPRVVPGTDPSHETSSAVWSVHRQGTGAHARRILTLALARHLAAARDGTLSSRSTGVPPPALA